MKATLGIPLVLRDCFFLALVVILSTLLYIGDLGFYSDDWAFLGSMSTSPDQSFVGLINSLSVHELWMRPIQWIYLATLYWLFGSHSLGYHVVNAAVLVSSVVLFHLVLRELGQARIFTLAVPLVYGFLPNYSTDRFWIAAFQANLSVAFYFLSLYADLRTLRTEEACQWVWKLFGPLGLIMSTLAYEVTLPLFLFNFLIIRYHRHNLNGSEKRDGSFFVVFKQLPIGNVLSLIAVVIFKLLTTTRLKIGDTFAFHVHWIIGQLLALDYGPGDSGLNLKQAIMVNFGTYGLQLPSVLWKIVRVYSNIGLFGLGGFIFFCSFIYLYCATRDSDPALGKSGLFRLMGYGFVIFWLGYAMFLTNGNIQLTPTGVGNRTAIAAALGFAVSVVGGFGWISACLAPERFQRSLFCFLVALNSTSGFLITNTLASFWKTAYGKQLEVLADMRENFPNLSNKQVVILDGVCPYEGPASVFENCWDFAGALRTLYHNDAIQADVVSRKLKVTEGEVSTFVYDTDCHYPYKNLFVYNFELKVKCELTSVEVARKYFQTFNPDHSNRCPLGYEGYGVPVF